MEKEKTKTSPAQKAARVVAHIHEERATEASAIVDDKGKKIGKTRALILNVDGERVITVLEEYNSGRIVLTISFRDYPINGQKVSFYIKDEGPTGEVTDSGMTGLDVTERKPLEEAEAQQIYEGFLDRINI